MSWQGILGHDRVAVEFARAALRNRLAGSFLFVGNEGIGKRTFAFALAKTLLCLNPRWKKLPEEELSVDNFVPCDECESCRLFDATAGQWEVTRLAGKGRAIRPKRGSKTLDRPASSDVISHPDLHYLFKPAKMRDLPLRYLTGRKTWIGNGIASNEPGSEAGPAPTSEEPIVSDQGLCRDISQRPFLSARKIAIINDADYLNDEGANALLKTLEEPPTGCIIILIGTTTARQLPTILSRCHIIRFSPLSLDAAAKVLVSRGIATSEPDATTLYRLARCLIPEAADLAAPATREFRNKLFHEFSRSPLDPGVLAPMITEFYEREGKDPPLRRKRLRLVLALAAEYDRSLLQVASGRHPHEVLTDDDQPLFEESLRDGLSLDKIVRRLDATLEAARQIDRNINLPYILDFWLDQEAKIGR